jgi:patatin-like phospholipase
MIGRVAANTLLVAMASAVGAPNRAHQYRAGEHALNTPDEPPETYRILSLDGGGIRGVFPAAFLARLEDHVGKPIGSYFDLIAGTSTGGIIAIGLGLGLSAHDILKLYEERGPAIFDQHHGRAENWLRQRWRGAIQLFGSKYSSAALRDALQSIMGDRRLGESRTRLVIPAWHPMLERVYIYKTAHHPRLESDYKQTALDAAMATAAAPTFLNPHLTSDAVELVDGGVWANNPIGVAAIEAIGVLGWPAKRLNILSIGTINDVKAPPSWRGKLPMASSVTRLFVAGQSHSALGTAKIVTGDGHDHKAIWRVDQTAPEGRYTMDNAARIAEMKNRAVTEAREQLPELRRHFFDREAGPFMPFHNLHARGESEEAPLQKIS